MRCPQSKISFSLTSQEDGCMSCSKSTSRMGRLALERRHHK